MNPGIYSRIILFFTTIGILVVLIAWTARTSWRRTGELHQQLAAKEWKSFQIADHMSQTILSLNNMMLRYAAYRNKADWTNFATTSKKLGEWFNAQSHILSSAKERPFIQRLNAAYADYLAAAETIHKRIYGARIYYARVVQFTALEKQSKRILQLALQLSEVHQQSVNQVTSRNIKSLNVLRYTLLGSLSLLLLAGVWLAIMVYRDMIAPLQVQLVESRQLMERQEKLASLGMLAAGVAHEIRNPLTAIKAWLYLQQKHLKPGTPEFADAELISGEITRLERIVKDVLQFARPSDPQFTKLPAEQPLREVQRLLALQLEKSNIKLQLETAAPALIEADPQQIKQVLINLTQNAADSIGQGGIITLRVRLGQKRLEDRLTDVVILEVQDNGKGIPAEAEKRLFDPFFTTKQAGTGLGLPLAARIIEKHHGALQYQTKVGVGTTFGILLPRHKS